MTFPLTDVKVRRLTVDEYHSMVEAGVLHEDDPVELLEGVLVEMSPIGSQHAGTVKRLVALLGPLVQGRAVLGVQDPVQLSADSEPVPDLTVLAPRDDYYTRSHPSPAEVWLAIEVAETSLRTDRNVKVPLYARAGIPEVWLIDLVGEQIEVYRDPEPDGYASVQALGRGDTLTCQALPDLVLPVSDVLI